LALTQTRLQVRDNVRRTTDTRGTNALVRHPDADLNEYINRGYAALYRKLTLMLPDQRFLSTQAISTVSGTESYALASDFDHLISIDILANGTLSWLQAYEMNERPALASDTAAGIGIPMVYRLRGDNIELLPSPTGVYTVTLWYVPASVQFSADNTTFDTISRLDDYVINYASKQVAVRDKNWQAVNAHTAAMQELDQEIEAVSRSRDKNSPSRIVDESGGWRRHRRMRLR
jgi:hypothetical protein